MSKHVYIDHICTDASHKIVCILVCALIHGKHVCDCCLLRDLVRTPLSNVGELSSFTRDITLLEQCVMLKTIHLCCVGTPPLLASGQCTSIASQHVPALDLQGYKYTATTPVVDPQTHDRLVFREQQYPAVHAASQSTKADRHIQILD